ncbi:MAG: alpha-glucosidase C-terminal domain-containing protein [Anaerolinea sp.]|nr:alpha-glucosidase C-terminal domain-containing protein [Anaerolinea sp.]
MISKDAQWLAEQAEISLQRLTPRILPILAQDEDAARFMERLTRYFPDFFASFIQLYGDHYDVFYHLEQTLIVIAQTYVQRSAELRLLDQRREDQPLWFQSEQMMGAVGYVDLFAGDLAGVQQSIPYFQELGLTYLHLMPLFRSPEKNNDGGYAVSSFREVNPKLGTTGQLAELTSELRQHGISLVLDFVFNHTSDEHEWAQKALSGDREYQAYYRMFDDRTLPDQYEPHLREIFPEQAPGSFTHRPEISKWVWTTFYPFQWDLNYANPALFRAMLGEMLFLANQGVEILRLDAVPFIWKRLGTNCENLPEAHILIRAYNALMRIAAPALLFKSEAIVHPRDVRSYIGSDECQISYNPIMMVSIWEALATRETDFMRHTLNKQFTLPVDAAWINYLRSHDDIGWGFADEDAAELGINGFDHRYFLNLFYTGRFPGSFAAGVPFNYNPRTQDMRISGTLASLAGLEKALAVADPTLIDAAVRRILMVHSLILSAGGIPLIYLGDEIGTINDYRYVDEPTKAADSRWVHRPKADAAKYAQRLDEKTIEGRIYQNIRRLIMVRKTLPALANGDTRFVNAGNRRVLGFIRHDQILVLANFSEHPQSLDKRVLRQEWSPVDRVTDILTGKLFTPEDEFRLEPYQFFWLKRET